jgi:hypothetical protein
VRLQASAPKAGVGLGSPNHSSKFANRPATVVRPAVAAGLVRHEPARSWQGGTHASGDSAAPYARAPDRRSDSCFARSRRRCRAHALRRKEASPPAQAGACFRPRGGVRLEPDDTLTPDEGRQSALTLRALSLPARAAASSLIYATTSCPSAFAMAPPGPAASSARGHCHSTVVLHCGCGCALG